MTICLKKITKIELAIDYIRSVNPDGIVVGVDNIQQFKIITELLKEILRLKILKVYLNLIILIQS